MSDSSSSFRSPAITGRGAIRTATPTPPTRSPAGPRSPGRARAGWGSRCAWARWEITNGSFGNRPHCIYRGFCLQACKVNAKASPLVTHIPDAIAHGAEIRADAW